MADQDQAPSSQPNSPQDQGAPSPETSAQSQAEGSNELPVHDYGDSGSQTDEIEAALAAARAEESGEGGEKEASAESRESSNGESVGPAKEEAAPASDPTDKVKPSALASFHRQQKELFQAQQAFKAKETEYARVMGILENAKSDRLAALELMGYSDTRAFLESIAEDGGRETPERKQIRELQAWKANQEKQAQERQIAEQKASEQAQVQAKLDQIRLDIQNTLKSDQYSSGLLGISGADDAVLGEMDRMATETGEMPRMEDAMAKVEATMRSHLLEMAKNPEVAKIFASVAGQAKSGSNGTPQSKTRAKQQTIDSGMRSPGTRITADMPPPSDDEVLAEAMAFLKNAQV